MENGRASFVKRLVAAVLRGADTVHIWVDADACPNAIKEILYRAAERVRVPLTLVANRPLWTPRSPYIDSIQVPAGFDVADKQIVDKIQANDLVITADIPLAAAVIEKGGHALDPRGELYTESNVRERLSVRDFMDELRGSGVVTGGPSEFSQGNRKEFANALDRILSQWKNNE
jgi:uncharacterized protein YaiI (UPF0178 family)